MQVFKYKIGNEQYNILTSIEKLSIAEVKAMYWLRWKIETDFKKIKYDVLMSRIRSKNYNSFLVDIHCIKLVCMFPHLLNITEIKKPIIHII